MTTEVRQDTGYGMIPRSIMRDKSLSIQSKAIYAYLAGFAGTTKQAFPSVSLMLHELDLSKDTFYKYMNELKDSGAVEVKRESAGKGKFGKNIYHLKNEVNREVNNIATKEEKAPCPKSSDTESSDTESSDTESWDTISNNHIINNTITNKERKGGTRLTENLKDEIIEEWNKLELQQLTVLNDSTRRYKMLRARIEEYSYEQIIDAIRRIDNSKFLKGEVGKDWTITFDWLVRPNNFYKVLEGNYDDNDDKGGGSDGPRAKQTTKEDAQDDDIDWAARAGVHSF